MDRNRRAAGDDRSSLKALVCKFLFIQSPANYFYIGVAFGLTGCPVGIAADQCAVIQLEGIAETPAAFLPYGGHGIEHDPVMFEIESEPTMRFHPKYSPQTEGRLLRWNSSTQGEGKQ